MVKKKEENFGQFLRESMYRSVYRGSDDELPAVVWDLIEQMYPDPYERPFIHTKRLITTIQQLEQYKNIIKDGEDTLPKEQKEKEKIKVQLNLPKNKSPQEILKWLHHRPKKKQTWFLIIHLNGKVSFDDFKAKEKNFSTAVGGWCEIERVGSAVYMTVSNILLPRKISFNFNPFDYPKMELPILFGFDTSGAIVLDLSKLISVLIAGLRDYGKSGLLFVIIYTLLSLNKNLVKPKVVPVIADPKNREFEFFQKYGALWGHTLDEIETLFNAVDKEYKRRVKLIGGKARNIFEYKAMGNDIPFIVVIADEMPMLGQFNDFFYRVLTQYRWMGIYVIGAAQRVSSTMWDKYKKNAWMDVKSQFECRVAFKMVDSNNSRMMFDSDKPANLPFNFLVGQFYIGMRKRNSSALLPLGS
jgi:hypothetical protein